MAPDEKAVEQAADELYGLAPGEFTSARDARAKELRSAGDREAANAVKALRKPTVAAWALNQLSRRKGKDLDRLLAAGEKLRGAQEELLAGGDRSAFQDAAARERELVAELTGTTAELAGEAGERGPGLEEKVAATLHAAALDNQTAAELRAGRLLREREAIGGFGAAAPAPEPAPERKREPAKKAAKARTAKGSDARKDAKAREDAERRKDAEQRKDAGQRKDAERREAAERRQRLAAARTDERHARRELEAAEKALGSAAARAEAAEAHAADANKRAKTAKQRLEEARRAQTAARKAHARAEKALASAESG